jgi:putative ABC transport system substrate-binding protein
MEKPTVAILRFGDLEPQAAAEFALLDILLVYGFLTFDERAAARSGTDFEGENINLIFGSANADLPTANLMVESALDNEVDALFTISTPVTQIAINATLGQEQPTPVIFTYVYTPYESGIALDSCLKPAHVTGSYAVPPYAEAFDVFLRQNPDMKNIGTIFSSNDASGVAGAEEIAEIGESLGIQVETAAVTNVSDLRAATQSLFNRGVEALVLPIDHIVDSGLPIIVAAANDNQIPTFMANSGGVYYGVTVSAGFYEFYAQGIRAGLMLVSLLNGELDPANTMIDRFTSFSLGVNQDTADAIGIEIAEDLLDSADIVVKDGAIQLSDNLILQTLDQYGAPEQMKQMVVGGFSAIPVDVFFAMMRSSQGSLPRELFDTLLTGRRNPELMQADQAFLASLECTAEMIAEQQAALDAASS